MALEQLSPASADAPGRRWLRTAATSAVAGCVVVLTGCSGGGGSPSAVTTSSSSSATSSPASSDDRSSSLADTTSPSQTQTTSADSASSTAASSAPAGTDALDSAYAVYRQAMLADLDPQICQDILGRLSDAAESSKLTDAHEAAAGYRTALYNLDTAIRKIDFPATVRSAVNDDLQADRVEIADLDGFASVTAAGADATIALGQIFVDDDDQVGDGERLAAALGHPVTDGRLPIKLADDQLILANFTLRTDFAGPQSADQKATDLASKRAAAASEAKAFAQFVAAVGKIDFPAAAGSPVAELTTASQSVTAAVQNNQSATTGSQLADITGPYTHVADAVRSLDAELGSQLNAATEPDHGCTNLTGAAPANAGTETPTPVSSAASTATSSGGTSWTTMANQTTLTTSVHGTGWTAMLPVGWTVNEPESGDDLDATVPDGAQLSITTPQSTSADAKSAGQAAADQLAGKGYRIEGGVAVDSSGWAGSPSYSLSLTTADGSVDIDVHGVVHNGQLIVITLAVPHGAPDAGTVGHVLSALDSTWAWS